MITDTLPAALSAPEPEDPNDIGAIVRARGVLVSLEITTWSGRKLDKRATRETNDRAGADADASRVNKMLLGGKVPSYSATIASAGAARSAYYAETLPWSDEGTRLLPITNYFGFAKIVRECAEHFRGTCESFYAEYPRLIEDARRRLGSMYDPRDYPDLSEIKRRFRFRVNFTPVPAASDIRLDLPPEVTAHMERSISARVERATRSAVEAGWERLAESVQRISTRLREIADAPADSPSGRLHASLFEGAVETAETLKRLNVLGDPNLDAAADRIIRELAALDPKALRKDASAMLATAQAADDILAQMANFYGGGAA